MIPEVSVILPFHDPKNEKYLRETTIALCQQAGIKFEVIVVLTEGVEAIIAPTFKIYTMPGKSTFAKKMNYGVRLSDPRSKYIMLLSDDVILGSGCLKDLAESCGDRMVITNPFSNCDNGRNYATPMPWEFSHTLEDVNVDQIKEWPNRYPVFINAESVCFYATMIPRKVWDLVGELDETFDTGCEDTDYCMRARQLGIASQISMRAFAFHFVGKTSSDYCTPDITKRNHDIFEMKWGFRLVPKN